MWAGLLSMPLLLCSSSQRSRPYAQANSKANHLGTYPGDASHANPNGAAAAAGAGAGAGAGVGLAGRMPSFKNKVASLLKALHMKIT